MHYRVQNANNLMETLQPLLGLTGDDSLKQPETTLYEALQYVLEEIADRRHEDPLPSELDLKDYALDLLAATKKITELGGFENPPSQYEKNEIKEMVTRILVKWQMPEDAIRYTTYEKEFNKEAVIAAVIKDREEVGRFNDGSFFEKAMTSLGDITVAAVRKDMITREVEAPGLTL